MNGLFSISYMGYIILAIDELHHFPRWLKKKKTVVDLVSLSETGVYHLVIFMSFFPYSWVFLGVCMQWGAECTNDFHRTIPSFNQKKGTMISDANPGFIGSDSIPSGNLT